MNLFFQALVSRFLRENLAGCDLVDQYALKGMMVYATGFNSQQRTRPTPRPDYVVKRQGKIAAVLDAKYRDLWQLPLPRDMLYQLAIYALSGISGGAATIVYPTMSSAATEQRIEVQEPLGGKFLGRIHLRPVRLLELADAVAMEGTESKRTRARLANQIAFGA